MALKSPYKIKFFVQQWFDFSLHVAPPDCKLFGTLVLLRPIKKLPMHGYQKTELLPLELPWRYHGQKFGIEIYIDRYWPICFKTLIIHLFVLISKAGFLCSILIKA